jgi:hypothetical protein
VSSAADAVVSAWAASAKRVSGSAANAVAASGIPLSQIGKRLVRPEAPPLIRRLTRGRFGFEGCEFTILCGGCIDLENFLIAHGGAVRKWSPTLAYGVNLIVPHSSNISASVMQGAANESQVPLLTEAWARAFVRESVYIPPSPRFGYSYVPSGYVGAILVMNADAHFARPHSAAAEPSPASDSMPSSDGIESAWSSGNQPSAKRNAKVNDAVSSSTGGSSASPADAQQLQLASSYSSAKSSQSCVFASSCTAAEIEKLAQAHISLTASSKASSKRQLSRGFKFATQLSSSSDLQAPSTVASPVLSQAKELPSLRSSSQSNDALAPRPAQIEDIDVLGVQGGAGPSEDLIGQMWELANAREKSFVPTVSMSVRCRPPPSLETASR